MNTYSVLLRINLKLRKGFNSVSLVWYKLNPISCRFNKFIKHNYLHNKLMNVTAYVLRLSLSIL